MTYHDTPYYECNFCGKTLNAYEDGVLYLSGWTSPSYDVHYCDECSKHIEEEKE